MSLSFLPRDSRAFLSSGLILMSPRNFTKVSLLVPIWSRYCWGVMPCANRSLVTMQSPWAALPHGGEINGELRDFPLLGVAHHEGDPALGIEPVGGEDIDASRGVLAVLLAEGGPLVLHEAGLDGEGSRHQRGRIEPGKVDLVPPESGPEGEHAGVVLEHGLDVTRLDLFPAEGRVASGEGETVEGRHDHEGLARRVAEAPLRSEFLEHDALLARADGLLAVAIGQDERDSLARSHPQQRDHEHQERKKPVVRGFPAHVKAYCNGFLMSPPPDLGARHCHGQSCAVAWEACGGDPSPARSWPSRWRDAPPRRSPTRRSAESTAPSGWTRFDPAPPPPGARA